MIRVMPRFGDSKSQIKDNVKVTANRETECEFIASCRKNSSVLGSSLFQGKLCLKFSHLDCLHNIRNLLFYGV